MRLSGWIFMLVTWTLILTMLSLCFYTTFQKDKKQKNKPF